MRAASKQARDYRAASRGPSTGSFSLGEQDSERHGGRSRQISGSEVGVLFSMTGYGEASYSSDTLQLAIELRAVNNRYLKVSLRAVEPYNMLEPEFEKVIRQQ